MTPNKKSPSPEPDASRQREPLLVTVTDLVRVLDRADPEAPCARVCLRALVFQHPDGPLTIAEVDYLAGFEQGARDALRPLLP